MRLEFWSINYWKFKLWDGLVGRKTRPRLQHSTGTFANSDGRTLWVNKHGHDNAYKHQPEREFGRLVRTYLLMYA
jgi:hypothetical protein